MGICEFLPVEYKKRLLSIANVDELQAAGYTYRSAYNAKRLEIISDERCDRLVEVLGKRALPILKEALDEFSQLVDELEKEVEGN
jgi:hypothetical protein